MKFIDVGTNETINETICAFYDRPEWEQKLMWSDQGCWLDYEKEGKHLKEGSLSHYEKRLTK